MDWSVLRRLGSRLAPLGRTYAILGQVYFGVGTCFGLYFLATPLWVRSAFADAFGNAIFAFFLWPVVLAGRAAN